MSLGTPRTNKFKIGTAEVRIGPLTSANKLTQAHSIGLLDKVTVEVSQESVDLEGGFPKFLADTAIIRQASSVTATLREYSRRNIKAMLGAGVSGTEPTGAVTTLSADAAVDAVSVTVTSATGIVPGDLIVLYPTASPEQITVARVTAVSTNTLTLDAGTPILFDYTAANGVAVYAARQVAIGDVSSTNYFAVQVIEIEKASGRPVGYNFWKSAVSTGMTDASNADDFASTDLTLKLLAPAAAEYGTGGDLEHLANIIPSHPVGMYFAGADS